MIKDILQIKSLRNILMYRFFFISFILIISSINASCPEDFFEDNCGNCWLPYCYDVLNDESKFDLNLEECSSKDFKWVLPDSEKHIYSNKFCDDSCPENFMSDDCGKCWSGFCYSFFSKGLNGDPAHSVYYDLKPEECKAYGYNYYQPNNRFSPYWNSQCTKVQKKSFYEKYNRIIPISALVIGLYFVLQ